MQRNLQQRNSGGRSQLSLQAIEGKLMLREEARYLRDFRTSDSIRDELQVRGAFAACPLNLGRAPLPCAGTHAPT